MVDTYIALDFFPIEHAKLPEDVRECMPLMEDRVCMKFLLPEWQKNRYDLLDSPLEYPDSPEGIAMREFIR